MSDGVDGVEDQIEALILDDRAFAVLERELDVFCPFEAMGMIRQEIRHGAFLTYLFDPARPHGFGAECLRALMSAATASVDSAIAGMRPIDAHLMRYDDALVRQWRNVDILVEVPSERLVVAIELKIDAGEHGGQLGRYRSLVTKEWPGWRHLFLFLTKRGAEPSEEDGEGWGAVEIEALIDEFDRVLAQGAGTDASKLMLRAYVAMLRRRHLTDERLEKLARDLWARHRAALEFLADRRPDGMSDAIKLLSDRREEMAKALSVATGLDVICDDSTPRVLRFAVPAWDAAPDMLSSENWTASRRLILVELRSWPRAMGAYLVLGPGDAAARERLHARLVAGGAPVNKQERIGRFWKRLASRTLTRVKEDEEINAEAVAQKAEKDFLAFMPAQLIAFDKALSGGVGP